MTELTLLVSITFNPCSVCSVIVSSQNESALLGERVADGVSYIIKGYTVRTHRTISLLAEKRMSTSREYAVDESSDTKDLHAMDVYKDVLTEDLSWLRDNDYILRGYRTPLTFWESIVR